MDFTTIIGSIGGFLTTISFLPQVIKTWRSKSAEDFSLLMLLCFCTGLVFWIVYGILTKSFPVLSANLVTLILAGSILFFKLKYE